MSEFHPNRVRPPRPRFTGRRLLNFWPLAVWFVVLLMAFWAFRKGVKFNRMNGIVDVIQEAVTSDEDGRINKILVKPGQVVKQGDPVVELDTAVIDAQITKLEAAIRADLEDKILTYKFDLARLNGQLRDLLRDQAADQGELSGIEDTVKGLEQAQRTAGAAYAGVFAQAIAKVRGNQFRLQGLVPLYEGQLKDLQKDIDELKAGLDKLVAARDNPESLASANGDLAELQELRALKAKATIRSSHDGVVDKIDRDDGEFVKKGEPMVRIVSNPEMIRGFLPQDQMGQVAVGRPVWISSSYDRYKYYKSKIISVSPRVSNVADRTSPLPNRVVHGQEIIAEYPKEAKLQPGQTIIIHLEEPGEMPVITRWVGQGKAFD